MSAAVAVALTDSERDLIVAAVNDYTDSHGNTDDATNIIEMLVEPLRTDKDTFAVLTR
jgi:hypothetical protein